MRSLIRAAAAVAALVFAGNAGGAQVARPKMRLHLGAEPPVQPGQVVPVEIRLLDDAGAPIDAPVSLDVDAGKASTPARSEPGVYLATITVPRRLPSTRSLFILARAGQSTIERSLELSPGPAVALHVEGPSSCAVDAEACGIDVSAEDADGNPAAEIPFGDADLGRVLPAGWAEAGRWVIVYQPPRIEQERTDRVRIGLGKLHGKHELRISPPRARLGFAPMAGAVRQKGRTGFAAGAQVLGERRVGMGWLLGAGLEVGWWSLSRKGTVAELDVSTDANQLGAGLLLRAERAVAGRLALSFSLGGGAVRVSTTSHVEGQPGVTDAGWAPMASLAAGLGWRYRFGMPFLELRQAWVGDAHLLTDPGAKWPFLAQAGFRLDIR